MERELVQNLCRRFPNHPCLKLGPGDDAAILEVVGTSPEIVVSTDMLTEGVDYLLQRVSPRKIGRKAMGVNLSDLAAMAAEPLGCVIAVALPEEPIFPDENGVSRKRSLDELMEQLCDGFLELAETFPIAIAGGDTNIWKGGLVLSLTVIGRVVGKSLCRRGARAGDAIFVTGNLGGSILGRQFDFLPRIQEMATLRSQVDLHAGMDISDGLLLDLSRLTQQSHCGAILDLTAIPISPDAYTLSALQTSSSPHWDWIPQAFASRTPLEHALGDGEDFEILFTVSPEDAWKLEQEKILEIPLTRIGKITSEPGIFGFSAEKGTFPLKILGFEHSSQGVF
ncbi:MAG: thiamine-phosphate kinase [Planctomycetia bacterium]|nr:thiamine-phosphate kinase [Planctomycetia bacterium]